MSGKLLIQVSQVTIAACLLIIVLAEYILPWAAYVFYQNEFKQLTVECDTAMHDEVAIRDMAMRSDLPNELINSANVELAICHQYDKLQKRLLILGVNESRLSLLGLEALESERIPVNRLVEPHRMPRF